MSFGAVVDTVQNDLAGMRVLDFHAKQHLYLAGEQYGVDVVLQAWKRYHDAGGVDVYAFLAKLTKQQREIMRQTKGHTL